MLGRSRIELVAAKQSAVAPEPGGEPLDPPMVPVTTQILSIRSLSSDLIVSMRTQQIEASVSEMGVELVTVVGPVREEALRLMPRATGTVAGHRGLLHHLLGKNDISRRSCAMSVSQKQIRPVRHHHVLCASVLLRLSGGGPPSDRKGSGIQYQFASFQQAFLVAPRKEHPPDPKPSTVVLPIAEPPREPGSFHPNANAHTS